MRKTNSELLMDTYTKVIKIEEHLNDMNEKVSCYNKAIYEDHLPRIEKLERFSTVAHKLMTLIGIFVGAITVEILRYLFTRGW